MAQTLLDASAMLAVILEETGADVVVEALRSGTAMSAVNAAEVAARLYQEGWGDEEVSLVFRELGIRILPFDADAALLSGRYRVATQSLGLGLGDRACLASASIEACPALTADKAWEQLNLSGVDIRCIR
ncbi:MAG: type II toxin-antitoxin system VapC family toxin [Gammaproteobacteria bacterium]|nr:type II toxin-antitoxin system VapC family toxin [Gammaproteobacteria bacterium]MDE0514589.1 type II toxin-antitoxin system VapC family toxin [Gammaproteobacteria bacterium]